MICKTDAWELAKGDENNEGSPLVLYRANPEDNCGETPPTEGWKVVKGEPPAPSVAANSGDNGSGNDSLSESSEDSRRHIASSDSDPELDLEQIAKLTGNDETEEVQPNAAAAAAEDGEGGEEEKEVEPGPAESEPSEPKEPTEDNNSDEGSVERMELTNEEEAKINEELLANLGLAASTGKEAEETKEAAAAAEEQPMKPTQPKLTFK